MNAISSLMSRMNLASLFGTTFGGKRDLYDVFGYKKTLTHADFLFKYLRQDVAQRVIHAPVDAVWTEPPMLKTGEKEWKEWSDFAKENKVYHYIRNLDIFASLGQFAVLLIGLDDNASLEKPVNTGRTNKLLYLQPYREGSVKILKYIEDTSSPLFGRPELYEITPGHLEDRTINNIGDSAVIRRKSFKVHHSRILHVAENALEDGILGYSRLQPIFNNLDDLQKITGGSAETYWLGANRGMQVDVDKEMTLNDDDEQNLTEELEEYQHQLRRFIRTRGVKVTPLGGDVSDPKNSFYVQIALISSTTGIPQRVLMGAEAGLLASQQDRANWATRINERIKTYSQPVILLPFVEKMSELNVIKKPEGLEVEWPEVFKMNPLERAQTSAQMARSAANIVKSMQTAQAMKVDFITIEEAREIVAPGTKMPILTGTPKGTLPPDVEETDPGKFGLLPTVTPGVDNTGNPTNQPPQGKNPDISRPEDTRGVNA